MSIFKMVLFPEEAAMTLAELRQMAARQQHQIEAQQQLLVAKEQRLKFLKQQEARHHTFSEQQMDVACLQNLREKVETQELKLRQLRALRSQVEQQKTNNVNLGTELDSIRALFSEKEKELSLAVNKVEELTRQLDEIKKNNRKQCFFTASSLELENLKKELLYRTKLSEQQNSFICQQRENIAYRQQDISLLDKKINELTKRLHRKQLLNEQLASQIHNVSLSKNSSSLGNTELYNAANIVAVEPILRESQEPDHTQDDMSAKFHRSNKEDLGEFTLNKNDPKYQTLPYNTKFTLKEKQSEDSLSSSTEDELAITADAPSNKITQLSSLKSSTNMCNFSPRPFNSIVPRILTQNLENGHSSQVFTPVESKTCSSEHMEVEKITNRYSSDNLEKSSIQIDNEPFCCKENSISEISSEENEGKNNSHIKPKVPPKPALPVKPMLLNKHVSSTVMKRKTEEKDLVNIALSVLQNKSSDKSCFSNYRERLLYYRCIPRYPVHRETLCDASYGENRLNSLVKSATEHLDTSKKHDVNENGDISKSKSAFGQLPIKPKPLTIRKTPGLEPPKLKVQQLPLSSAIYRKGTDSNLLNMNIKTCTNIPSFQNELLKDDDQKQSKQQDLEEKMPVVKIDILPDPSEVDSKLSENTKINEEYSGLKVLEISSEEKNIEKQIKNNSKLSEHEDLATLKLDLPEIIDKEEKESYHGSAFHLVKKGNLKSESSVRNSRRVSFDPLALLLDAALEGELELVKKTAAEVPNPSAANDEGITALHNAICAGHFDVVTFLVEFGCDVNAQDSDGWTPLHCAASCNNLPMVKFLIERGACIFATTLSDHETAAEKCEEDEEGFDGCSEYLYSLQENLGVMNNGVVYAVYDYEVQNADELSFKDGDKLVVLRKGDDEENEWWWSRLMDEEGYVPRNLLGLFPRVKHRKHEEFIQS